MIRSFSLTLGWTTNRRHRKRERRPNVSFAADSEFGGLSLGTCVQVTIYGADRPQPHVIRLTDGEEDAMAETSYYVYALKDPRRSPAVPFYVGKGTGIRAYDHLVRPDDTRKGKRIREITEAGHRVLVTHLADELTELQAIKLEAELIAAFGTEDTGGLLANTVMPSGLGLKVRRNVILPSGVREKAQLGLALIKDAILELAKANPRGIANSDAASLLGLRSDYGGGSKDYLTYSVIGLLMREGRLARDRNSKKHFARVE